MRETKPRWFEVKVDGTIRVEGFGVALLESTSRQLGRARLRVNEPPRELASGYRDIPRASRSPHRASKQTTREAPPVMTDPKTLPLADERYINLETFRKDGTGVKTPVWVAPLDGALVIVTGGDSFKVKRIRNNGKVRVAPCDARGNVRGAWVEGSAQVVDDPAVVTRAHAALRKKYGLQFAMLDLFARISGRIKARAYLAVTLATSS